MEPRHAEEFFRLVQANYERLSPWCPWLDKVDSIESTRTFLRDKLERFADSNGFTAGIFDDEKLIGVIALEYIDHSNSTTEVGYWIDADAERKGIVIRACRAVVDYVFRELALNRVQIRCATANRRSRAIPEKLGFRQEGVIRECERLYDRTVDLVVYGMLSREWLKNGDAPVAQ